MMLISTEVIGALISVLMIWLVTAVLVFMAIQRVLHPEYEINASIMMVTAALGVMFNITYVVNNYYNIIFLCMEII